MILFSDLEGLGGVSSTTYEFGDPMETLEQDASGDLLLLLLLLCGGMTSSSPGWSFVVCWEHVLHRSDVHFIGVHPQADGGIVAGVVHEAGVDPCMGVAPPHVAGWLVRCPSAFDAVSALVVPPPSLPSIPVFRVVVPHR